MRIIILTLLLLLGTPVYAGDLELTITFPLGANNRPGTPDIQLGKGDVIIHLKSKHGSFVELGDLEWDYKYPKTFHHKDDYLDIDISEIYNRKYE